VGKSNVLENVATSVWFSKSWMCH